MEIRPLQPDGFDAWLPLWQGYQTFYGVDIDLEVTKETWARFHDEAEPMYVLGAFEAGELVAIVHFLYHRSTWTKGNYCYLQDLYTAEQARGKGAGRALIETVYECAEKAGASRVYWLTQEENTVARMLYDSIADLPGFIQYRHLF